MAFMTTAALALIDLLVRNGRTFTFTPDAAGATCTVKTDEVLYKIDEVGTIRIGETYEEPLPASACGDYPAPCNCDDPKTHNGH